MLKQWIAGGAQYQPHWSLIPPERAELPKVKNRVVGPKPDRSLSSWPSSRKPAASPPPRPTAARSPAGSASTSPACPPSRPIVEAFATDRSPDAYETLVTRLLASPHWGEHRARYWLDAARYADTNGYPLRQLPRSLGLSRLGDQRLQPQPALRPLHRSSNSPATCCPAARSTSKSPRASTAAT